MGIEFKEAVDRLTEVGPPDLPWEYRGYHSAIYAHVPTDVARDWITWMVQKYGKASDGIGGPTEYGGLSNVDEIMSNLSDEDYTEEENSAEFGPITPVMNGTQYPYSIYYDGGHWVIEATADIMPAGERPDNLDSILGKEQY